MLSTEDVIKILNNDLSNTACFAAQQCAVTLESMNQNKCIFQADQFESLTKEVSIAHARLLLLEAHYLGVLDMGNIKVSDTLETEYIESVHCLLADIKRHIRVINER